MAKSESSSPSLSLSSSGNSNIPRIDLEEYPFPYWKLREACEEWGCFRVVNHGVPAKVMSEMKSVSRSLLDLPVETKKRNTVAAPGRGYIGLGQISRFYESLGLSPTCPEAIHTFCSQLDLSESDDDQIRTTIEIYSGATRELTHNIANKIATSLNLELGEKKVDVFKDWFFNMRMVKYDFTDETIGCTALRSHTDGGFLTVLQDDEHVGGLKVMDKSAGCFVTVEPSPGNFLVILGDMSVMWSNGKFTSAKHKVECIDPSVRVSIVGLLSGPMSTVVY